MKYADNEIKVVSESFHLQPEKVLSCSFLQGNCKHPVFKNFESFSMKQDINFS